MLRGALIAVLVAFACGGEQAASTTVAASTSATTGGSGGFGGTGGSGGAEGGSAPQPSVLLFTKVGYMAHHHTSISAAVAALVSYGTVRGWNVAATEEAELFTEENLSGYDVVVFLLNNEEVLDDAQQAVFESFIRSGKGFVGVHSGAAIDYFWTWYHDLVGATYGGHPPPQEASVIVERPDHPATAHLPNPWVFDDEWYYWQMGPSPNVTVLLSVDETTYDPGMYAMGPGHPIAWYQFFDGGRAFYTCLGHHDAAWSDPNLVEHVAGGIVWAATPR